MAIVFLIVVFCIDHYCAALGVGGGGVGVGNLISIAYCPFFIHRDLVMKYFLWPFSLLLIQVSGSCQLLAKV